MTDSIKPPGGPATGPVGVPTAAAPTTGGFRTELEATAPAERAGRTDPLGAMVAELRSGTLTPEAVIDRLVERQLSSPSARGLAPAARAELERMLRARLEDDPALRALIEDVGRARP